MRSNALNSRGKPAVSLMSGAPTFDIKTKNRNGANLKLRYALRAGGVKSLQTVLLTKKYQIPYKANFCEEIKPL